MDILAILLGLVVAAAAVFFIVQPLRQARRTQAHVESQLDTLLARRESLFTQLRELDFDYATGKVVHADYSPLRDQLKREAADVLRQIDDLIGATAAETDIEQAIAARRKRKPVAAADAELEAAIAARRRATPALTADAQLEAVVAARRKTLACPNCGKPFQTGDAFCSRCGASLGTQVAR
jgi:hypothetical protein